VRVEPVDHHQEEKQRMKNRVLRLAASRSLRAVLFTAASAAAMALVACGSSDSSSSSDTIPIEAFLDTQAAQIGGATTAVAYTTVTDTSGTTEWTLFSMANRLASRPIHTTPDATFGASVKEITLPGYIQHILPVSYGGKRYALVSMGGAGLAVVDVGNPAAMVLLRTMTVNYDTPSYTYVDGGGTQFTAAAASHTLGSVNDVLIDDNGTPADNADDQLYIANGAFGIQKTKLSNLMDATASGVLAVDGAQRWTLKYAGENPWGGPLSLKMHNGRLYAALGFLGIGIYNPADLERTASYNLYADCTNTAQEDWFGYPKRKIACPNATLAPALASGDVDADGMPTYQRAGAELGTKTGLSWYPWAEFDRYGKYYYNALTLDVQDINGTTRAFIAYALGGLVAVDVPASGNPTYAGYVPAAPAHGPDEPTGSGSSQSILSYHGAGMLKDAGVKDVRVVAEGAGYRAYYTDHFAGLVVLSGAEAPGTHWKNGGGNFNNDTMPETFWPDYEFVKSYDMTPVLVGDEAVPKFLTADTNGNYSGPVMLATGELNGHGGALFMMPTRNAAGAGQIDVVESSGAGGVSLVDIKNLTDTNVAVADRFGVPVQLVSTNEVGANASGVASQMIAIGHAEGLTVSGNYVYLADGPHGMSVWSIANDNVHLVANTLQSEYPAVDSSGATVYPAPHAFSVAFGNDASKAYVLNQSVGLRKVDVSAVTGGAAKVGAPALLKVSPADIYEHSTEAGGNLGNPKIIGQDHAYGVAFYGNYAIVADGGNGLTVYDVTVPANATTGAHIVANLGGTATGQAPLGRAAAVKLWTNPANNRKYAVVAAGSSGISVVDMTDLLDNGIKPGMTLIKTFEPLKSDDDNPFGSADGKSVDVQIVRDYAYISYDSFGLVAYTMASLIQPVTETRPPVVPAGQAPDACASVTDVTKLSAKKGGTAECRPTAVAQFKLQKLPEYANVDGGAQHMTAQLFPPVGDDQTRRLLFYVAYGDAGVLKLDWTNPAKPVLMQLRDTIGFAGATAIANGRVYVSDGAGGLVVFKK
jgi:hypothetical protein